MSDGERNLYIELRKVWARQIGLHAYLAECATDPERSVENTVSLAHAANETLAEMTRMYEANMFRGNIIGG